MINLARAITTAGVALAVSLVAVPSASAVVREAGKTAAKAAAQEHKTPAQKAALKKSAGKVAAQNLAARPVTVNVYYVMEGGRVISEQGPGDSSAHEVGSNSGTIDMQTQNEPITTGDLNAEQNKGDVTFEVEGSEQDTGEVS